MTNYTNIPVITSAIAVTDTHHFLAEGPGWDAERERVFWVDIMAGAIYVGHLGDNLQVYGIERIEVPGTVGAVTPDTDGGMLIAGTHALMRLGPDGTLTAGPTLITGDDRRFNDGKPDPRGRFIVGTKGDGAGASEQLLRIDAEGAAHIIDADLTLSNGLAWSPNGTLMYSIDTLSQQIFVRSYDPESGAVGERRTLLTLTHGYPDGMTVDVEGHLWVAVWGSGCVLRITPDGDIIGKIELPAPHVSCPAFVGPDLGTLLITTARENMTDEQLAANPDAGRLFAARPGVSGVPVALAQAPHHIH